MKATVVVGAQWGDEGKGKVVDQLAAEVDLVVRYSGGANAGHTLVVDGEKIVFHLMPCGALHPEVRCVLGPGMVIDPTALEEELGVLESRGLLGADRVLVSDCAHVVLPHHRLVDELRERGPNAIGTTKRGIGPAYEDRAARRSIRIGDLGDAERLRLLVEKSLEAWAPVITALGGEAPNAELVTEELRARWTSLSRHVGDAVSTIHAAREAGEAILLEGAQGTMLDVDHGTVPFVTSSSVTAAGACTGSGLGPTHVGRVVGIAKAYTTRVGDGPFPTELDGPVGDHLRNVGAEFGATTGRPRRCGWLDIPLLRHAARVNGLTEIALTKLDVLRGLDPLRVAIGYRRGEETLAHPPSRGLADVEPIYEELPGFSEDLRGARVAGQLPANARAYVRRVEELIGLPIRMVGVGPDREETLLWP